MVDIWAWAAASNSQTESPRKSKCAIDEPSKGKVDSFRSAKWGYLATCLRRKRSRQVPAPSTDTKASCSDKKYSHLSWSSASTFCASAGFVSFYSSGDPTAGLWTVGQASLSSPSRSLKVRDLDGSSNAKARYPYVIRHALPSIPYVTLQALTPSTHPPKLLTGQAGMGIGCAFGVHSGGHSISMHRHEWPTAFQDVTTSDQRRCISMRWYCRSRYCVVLGFGF